MTGREAKAAWNALIGITSSTRSHSRDVVIEQKPRDAAMELFREGPSPLKIRDRLPISTI
jgi:hypothetical protein